MKKKTLIISAHPDDESLGCGGYIIKYSKLEDMFSLFLSDGVSSRNIKDKKIKNEINIRKKNSLKAQNILGIKNSFYLNYPDNQLDIIPFLEIVKKIEEIISKIRPDKILTHSNLDLNIDHRIVSKAVITATRPTKKNHVKEILFYEILSSSEWNFGSKRFVPNYYVDVSKELKQKIKAFNCYRKEIEKFPHPRSIIGLKTLMKYRGMESGLNYAEGFNLVRSINK